LCLIASSSNFDLTKKTSSSKNKITPEKEREEAGEERAVTNLAGALRR
jgi:hypothetical protein